MQRSSPALTGLLLEGNLLAPAILKEIGSRSATSEAVQDYALPRGLTLRDELARFFRIGQAIFRHLHASPSPSLAATVRFASEFLTQVLGFPAPAPGRVETVHERQFPVTLQALNGRVPVLAVPPDEELDAVSAHLRPDGRRRSAATALQDWLNVSDDALWGLCTNGVQLRLLRDNPSLTRPAFVEFDLRQIFENEDFSSFTLLWLLLHSSRFGPPDAPVTDCSLERWREAGVKTGEVALQHLSGNVREALLALANGFLQHPGNAGLRERLASGALALSSQTSPTHSFFSQLLRLVYRLIFLLAAEDRDLLHPPGTPMQLRELYQAGYSVVSLRDRAVRHAAWDAFDDRWQGLQITFRSLAHGEPRLGLPALGGLFAQRQTPDLDALALSNRALLDALYKLAWLRAGAAPVRVNWRDMQTEELGSVYEGLLELTPRLGADGRSISFAEGVETRGNERKTTGSYYTPDALVQTLLDSALDPVLDRLEAEAATGAADPAATLLTLTVLDPACGSGHFLLAAARRIAARAAKLRSGGVPAQADYRHALRDVVRLCIHGVDRNPMAVELARVALWIETVEPGKPLGFLDANLRCGDALLGVFSLDALREGIPEAAYKPLAGDDKAIAGVFKARNREDLKGQARLDFSGRPTALPVPPALAASALALRGLPEDSEQDIEQRVEAFERIRANPELTRWFDAADLYTAAFLAPKARLAANAPDNPEFPGLPLVPVSSHVWRKLAGGQVYGPLWGAAKALADFARAFHWPLEFPHILLARDEGRWGFDVVLGNPPWERIKLQEQEFFAAREPAIAAAANAAARGRLITALRTAGERERALHDEFTVAQRTAEAASVFARVPAEAGGRFPLTGRGDVNTYALFAELFSTLASERGRAGVIVPTGIATDATTAPFFASLVEHRRLARLIDFENREAIFPGVHRSYKFSLLTVAHGVDAARFTFFLTDAAQLAEPDRTFTLSPAQIAAINPNTKTAPVFRSIADAALTARLYAKVPNLLRSATPGHASSWGARLRTMFHKANASHDGLIEPVGDLQTQVGWLPLNEGDYGHQFDHRFGTFEKSRVRNVSEAEHANPAFENTSEWMAQEQAFKKTVSGWGNSPAQAAWLAFRRVARSNDERTSIAALLPYGPLTYGWIVVLNDERQTLQATLCANLNALVLDYCLRNELSQPSIPQGTYEQLPILPPTAYTPADLAFLVPRVLELTYTSYSMRPFARDLGYSGEPFPWDERRRALLRAELDAWYARAYGLSRDDLRYILDPADLLGPDYPSETFRVLKNNELRKYGEYRTQRLVLAAWDRQAAGDPPESEFGREPILLEAPAALEAEPEAAARAE